MARVSWPHLSGLAVLAVLAGCAVPVAGTPAPAGSTATSPPQAGGLSTIDTPSVEIPRVRSPKDARGIAACDLLTPAQLTELGLVPESAAPKEDSAAQGCMWKVVGDAASAAGLSIAVDLAVPGLEGIHLVRDTLAEFEPTEVAGHPAIHADLTTGPVCTIYVAVADDQLLAADGDLAGRPRPDPCAPSRRMAELVLSNLPPLR